jgi:hypothetical protein
MNNDERAALLRRHATQLREHFDAVQIVASRLVEEDDMTTRYEAGGGCWFARYGLMRSWVIRNDESERICTQKSEGREDE